MADVSTSTAKCANCAKAKSDSGIELKRCAKCHTTHYCSRECQKADWKQHKGVCAITNASTTTNSPHNNRTPPNAAGQPSKGQSITLDKPFHRLESQTWLHDRPDQDVYRLLIDTYRFRMEDDYKLEGEASQDSIYGGADDGLRGFRRFLFLAKIKKGLLPPWWSQEKEAECEAVGMSNGWSSLASTITKSDIIQHYGSSNMPMQLRMLGEQVYGRGPAGQSSAAMRRVQMMAEMGR